LDDFLAGLGMEYEGCWLLLSIAEGNESCGVFWPATLAVARSCDRRALGFNKHHLAIVCLVLGELFDENVLKQ
jgi:hypothetical protein